MQTRTPTMIQTILFDLDETLLGNHMDTFLPSYFALLGKHAARYIPVSALKKSSFLN